ncbi:MAG: tRNA 2-selenouridine(34) synthase MnmH [Burkholderiales bacterium PBB4]|nr:MAG: tRNA 2-selenouridine(34) synthase MnmH [Burkholderiales bacterium PBB4]
MSLTLIRATELLSRLHEFDTIIDARTEAEFAEDRLPGAVNWPTLTNEERIVVGTMYKQISQFEAKKRGAAMAARNIAAHIDREVIDKPKEWRPLAYCWRGGKRSGSLALILDQIGFKTTLVEGGYKAFRAAIVADLALQSERLHFRVVCGTTGSGKTRLLHALATEGAQVLDLEGLARHRSSVLGAIPGVAQPTQKRFDMLVWDTLRGFSAERPVFVESESKKVGNVAIPGTLVERMRSSPCINLELPMQERIDLLLEDYDFFVQNREYFCQRLDALTEVRGRAVVDAWKDQVIAGNMRPVVADLLSHHYDPVYLQSIQRNFVQYSIAVRVDVSDRTQSTFKALAQNWIAAS